MQKAGRAPRTGRNKGAPAGREPEGARHRGQPAPLREGVPAPGPGAGGRAGTKGPPPPTALSAAPGVTLFYPKLPLHLPPAPSTPAPLSHGWEPARPPTQTVTGWGACQRGSCSRTSLSPENVTPSGHLGSSPGLTAPLSPCPSIPRGLLCASNLPSPGAVEPSPPPTTSPGSVPGRPPVRDQEPHGRPGSWRTLCCQGDGTELSGSEWRAGFPGFVCSS